MAITIKNIGTEEAYKKACSFCAYQERCHREVKEKLFSFGLYPEEVNELIVKLIESNYLNEERYAIAFAGGRFRMKKWGKVKIRYELKKNLISDYCIRKAFQCIDEADYMNTLHTLFNKKKAEVQREKNAFKRKAAIKAWLLRKGYEADLVSDILNNASAI